ACGLAGGRFYRPPAKPQAASSSTRRRQFLHFDHRRRGRHGSVRRHRDPGWAVPATPRTADLRPTARAAALLHVLITAQVFPESLAGDVDTVPRLQLIIRGRVAQLYDLTVTDRQDDAAA